MRYVDLVVADDVAAREVRENGPRRDAATSRPPKRTIPATDGPFAETREQRGGWRSAGHEDLDPRRVPNDRLPGRRLRPRFRKRRT